MSGTDGLFFHDVNQNHYQLLGVSATAPAADIKRAYRRLATALHPDKHGGDPRYEEQFKAVAVAYGVLSNPDRRAQYDFLLLQVARRAEELRARPAQPAAPGSSGMAGAPGSARSPYGAPTASTAGPTTPPLRTRPPAGRRERHYQQRVPRQQVRFNRQDALLVAGLLALMLLFGLSVKVVMDRVTASGLYDEARLALAQGQPWRPAYQRLDAALEFRADYPAARRLRGELAQDSAHDNAQARADYEAALQDDPDARALPAAEAAALLLRLGRCQGALGQPAAADLSFGRALARDSTLAAAYLARGENRLLALGQTQPGLRDLQHGRRTEERAGRRPPPPALLAEGAALAHLGRYAEALARYDSALAARPADGRTLFLLGRLAQQRGDSAGACRFFRRGAVSGYSYAVAAAARCGR